MLCLFYTVVSIISRFHSYFCTGSEGEPAHDEYDDEDEPEFDREQLLERYHVSPYCIEYASAN